MIDMPPFDLWWFLLLCGLVIGLAFGSFITMLSYRLPNRLSIVRPDSHCPNCKVSLKPIDLIPVGSWMLSGRKCRYCGVKISARYPLIELATAASFMAAFVWFGFQPMLVVVLAIIVAVITFATIKLESKSR